VAPTATRTTELTLRQVADIVGRREFWTLRLALNAVTTTAAVLGTRCRWFCRVEIMFLGDKEMRKTFSPRLVVLAASAFILIAVAAACGETKTIEVPGETIVVEKEVIKTIEVPGQTVTTEVIKEVQVPGQTITVTKEVIKEIKVPGETMVVTKEVLKEVQVPGETVVVEKIVVVVATPVPLPSLDPRVQTLVDDLNIPLYLPDAATSEPQYGGTINIRGLEPKSFDIHKYVSYRLRITNSYTHERLLQFDVGPGTSPTAHNVAPSLAESWEVSGGGKTYTFNLRKGVKWHNKAPVNGREFTASDVIFTLDRIKGSEQASQQNNVLSRVASYEAPDDYTVVFNLEKPVAAFPFLMARTSFEILAPEVDAECGGFVIPECSDIGTGPWVFESYSPGVATKMTRNVDYWNQPYPYIDVVQQLFFGDEKAEDAAFRTGKLDLLGVETCAISGERYRALLDSNPENVYPSFIDPFNRRAVWMKSDRPPFDDVRLRRAVAMAIDREGWVNSVLGGYGISFGGYLYFGNDYWLPDDEYGASSKYIKYDLDGAKALLADAGYYPGALEVTMDSTTGYGERFSSEAELVAEALNKLGIKTKLNMTDYNSFVPVWRDGAYDDIVYTWLGYGYDPEDWLIGPFHSELNGNKYFGLNDAYLDDLLDQISAETNLERRIKLSHDTSRYIMDQAYVVPGPAWLYFYAQNPKLVNYLYHDSFDNGHPLMKAWFEN